MHIGTESDPLDHDESGLSTALIDMVGAGTARAFLKDMYRGEWAQRVLARSRQKQRAAEMRLKDKHHALKTGHRWVAEIDLASYVYWQEKEPGCWADRGFLAEYLRDNEDVRVNQALGGASNRVAWTPTVDTVTASGIHTNVTRYTKV